MGQSVLKGFVVDDSTHKPIAGASILALPSSIQITTDDNGFFWIKSNALVDSLSVRTLGYFPKTFSLKKTDTVLLLSLPAKQITLEDVTVVANISEPRSYISSMDIALRGLNNSQEILRIIPGLFIGQHQGGGKAEQIFVRGFDADHGTDFRLSVDGMPINMVSHAHGQGFADSHFIIPETIDRIDFQKGSYSAREGDFATAGHASFQTKDFFPENFVKVEAGMFQTFRAVSVINLLDKPKKETKRSFYIASEYRFSDGYFINPQQFQRLNIFSKYHQQISTKTEANVSASTFWSTWDASGQIPERAVKEGLIDFYGAIDPTEGGLTKRSNLNVELVTNFMNGAVIKNQVYGTLAAFDLHTNFTFFLVDTINGDQFRQKEKRKLFGYNGSFIRKGYLKNKVLTTEAGINLRVDNITDAELSNTINRYTTLQQRKLGDINQVNLSPYINETVTFGRYLSLNAGLRFDLFVHRYANRLSSDTTLAGVGLYKANASIVSPKLRIDYRPTQNTQVYLYAGRGFHSNDTRVAVVTKGRDILPAAFSADLGATVKPTKNIILNAAAWYIHLQREFVYSGDGGFVEFSGQTRRIGWDVAGRYQPAPTLYLDVDVNYAHGRAVNEVKGEDFIPLAPKWTSAGGVTYLTKQGFRGSFRYRYLGGRPGNEDYSLTADGYFIADMQLGIKKSAFAIDLFIDNVFDRKWKETQFATETRLKGELTPVDEICFTPGTPFFAKLVLSFQF